MAPSRARRGSEELATECTDCRERGLKVHPVLVSETATQKTYECPGNADPKKGWPCGKEHVVRIPPAKKGR